ncbi:unnamed protein product [Cuscuta campestris]|uniref:SMP-30/Gluconolactonase/LRE-like region domain-containing protein n=1 Tax=Cuscuta campestris TaxID=132261 RepID=A0A484LDK9_9ASTE|nr:unnamed protein product [Cuscuta campestris]
MANSLLCSSKFMLLLFIVSAIPIAVIVHLETAGKTATGTIEYHSTGWLRECAKWDEQGRRFIVTFFDGGVGQIPVPVDYGGDPASPPPMLLETPVVKDADLSGNSSLGLAIDRRRNRILVAISDVIGNRFSGVAAYDLSTWNRLFLTKLSGAEDEKSFANDVAVDEVGNAYITDTRGGKIWKIGRDGELKHIIRSPLFTPKEWYKRLVGLNGIVYHPNGYLLVVHTFSGNLYKVRLPPNGDEAKVISVVNVSSLVFGDGMELVSPKKVVVAGNPTRMLESSDDWESARVVGKFRGSAIHRLSTAATVKDGRVYVNHMIGMGFPHIKHFLVEAVFSS